MQFVQSALFASCGAWIWDKVVPLEQLDFYKIGPGVPREIIKGLFDYWCDEQPGRMCGTDELKIETFTSHAQFISACLVKTLTRLGVKENTIFPVSDIVTEDEYDLIPDDISFDVSEFLSLKHALDDSVWHAFVWGGSGISAPLSESLYNSRESLFGGRFPFSIDECLLYSPFTDIYDDPRFWLACISNYGSEGMSYDPNSDPYSIAKARPWRVREGSLEGIKENNPRGRYRAFALAYEEMRQSNVHELADAWWAFFIASQSYAFPNLGLSPEDIADVLLKARECRAHEMMKPALRYALKKARENDVSLSSRVLRYEIPNLLEQGGTGSENVVEISQSTTAASWLSASLGRDVWETLNQQSQQDLIHSEQLWANNYRAAGLGRDWGSLIINYCRVIEWEVNRHQSDLIRNLKECGITVDEPTLGGIITLFRDANRALRKGELHLSSPQEAQRVRAVHAVFSEKARFIVDHRNRAAHGARDEPLGIEALVLWRSAIFGEGILRTLLNLEQT